VRINASSTHSCEEAGSQRAECGEREEKRELTEKSGGHSCSGQSKNGQISRTVAHIHTFI